MKIEYWKGGKEADVAFISPDFKLAVEVETGTNNYKQLVAKIPWLNKHFNKWIFICPKNIVPKYSKFVDNNKSFCLPLKKAKEKVLELISTTSQR